MYKIKPTLFTEFCGWYGMSALILAYALVSFGTLSAGGIIFQLLNITGSIGLLIDATAKKVIQLVLLNIFWALIGIITIIRLLSWV
jgi:predicted ATP-dependent Lon-type protease